MDTKHTPGPWRVGMRPGPMVYGPYGAQVADCRSPSAEGSEAGYNARLIAAAPDMLSALRAIEARAEGEWDHPALVAFGPLTPDTSADILAIARMALRSVEG